MIKSYLMDQSQIAGLGNIYVDETLFRSGVHPKTITSRISAKKADKLFNAIRETLQNSIGNMGTTISDYKTTGGGFGSYQNYLQVYGREGKPCPVCGTVIRKIRMNNRGTHFCPTCQRSRGVNL
jgi:formamidopyrimidine-DNA glycosylase